MPVYSRKINDKIILVRPLKWDAAEELPSYDCLDITDAIKHYVRYLIPRHNPHHDIEHPIAAEIRKNYSLYRSRPFTKQYATHTRMNNPFFGCCVVATEALFFLTPEKMEPTCYKARDGDGIWHWWLESLQHYGRQFGEWRNDESIIQDATAEQFDDLSFNPPYTNGKKTSLMGWKQSPSKRTLDLIENITGSKRYRSFLPFYALPEAPGNLEKFLRD